MEKLDLDIMGQQLENARKEIDWWADRTKAEIDLARYQMGDRLSRAEHTLQRMREIYGERSPAPESPR